MHSSKLILKSFAPIKNAFQYSIGSVLYFLIFNGFDIYKYILGMIGFLIAYQAVYHHNNLIDYKEDIKDKIRSKIRPLASGETTREYSESLAFILPVIGLTICFFVNPYFGLLTAVTLMLNFFHSSAFIKLKKTGLVIPNFFALEFLKFSAGWFALSTSLISLPYFFIAFLTLVYTVGYMFWKQNFKNFMGNLRFKAMVLAIFVFFAISLLSYPFKIAMITPMAALLLTSYCLGKISNDMRKVLFGVVLNYIVGASFIISALLLMIPPISDANSIITNGIDYIAGLSSNGIKPYSETVFFGLNGLCNSEFAKKTKVFLL
ncbi:MAG: UbiA family prenyltransferase [Candidatus Aenigmatarchaeota archaeon]